MLPGLRHTHFQPRSRRYQSNNALGLNATVTVVNFFAKGDSAVLLERKDKKDR